MNASDHKPGLSPYVPVGLVALMGLGMVLERTPHGLLKAGLVLVAALWWAYRETRLQLEARRNLADTVAQLNETVERWASGDLRARVYLDHEDPLDPLAHGMNRVAEVLEERTADLKEDKERLETILGSMANGIIIFNHGLTITLINRAALLLFRIPDPNVTGRHLLEVIRDVTLEDDLTAVTRRGQTVVREWSPREDESVTVELTIAPLKQPVGGLGAVLVARDISAQKEVDRMRADFVANVSHELQTPLTIIRGFTETLLDEQDPLAARRFIGLIHDEANRMSRLVDDLLTLSRIEHRSLPVRREPVDLTELIEGLAAKLGPRMQAAGLSFSQELPARLPPVCGDPDLLAEVFLNLVTNAIQYTPRGGRITVGGQAVAGEVAVSVRDTGIGIPAQDLPRIFERFYRVDRARSRASGGTGLGLAIVKHIVEIHRGRVEVSSTVGQGTTFVVWLPEECDGGVTH
ncbi:MAG: ATP-binding protein [Firmicutes bacterium]|nr:ATP-binding protein [Bacillota bacterium]